MKKWVSAVLLLLLLILKLTPSVAAQERIKSFDARYDIQRDGSMRVVETITYDFGAVYRHGIFRTIPFVKTNVDGKKYKLDIENINVNSAPYSVSRSGENISIKIGDPDETVTGENIYVITYSVKGALTYFSDHDELYWNVTGNGWEVPIDSSNIIVSLPEAPAGQDFKLSCYTGSIGSTTADCSFRTDRNIALFSSSEQLSAYEGITVVTGFPKNMVAVLEPEPYATFWETWYGKILSIMIIWSVAAAAFYWYIAYPVKIIFKWLREGRDPRMGAGEARAWYGPPTTKQGRNLSPAETGTLIDETASQADISATVVDLARRGYLKIEERKKNDFYFIKHKPNDKDLEPFEKDLLTGIFSTKDEVRLKDKKLYELVSEIKQTLYKKLVDEGFFPEDPEKIRTFYTVIGVFALMTFNVLLTAVAFVFGRSMPRKTEYGAQAAQMARGLRNFLTSQERQLEHMAKNQINFEKLLPFAVAFGAEKIWAERFKDIELKEPEWYSGYSSGSRFNSVYLTNRLGSSFNTLTTSSTPTRSSSGFSSGSSGGFSGGGGGGGGGGSW